MSNKGTLGRRLLAMSAVALAAVGTASADTNFDALITTTQTYFGTAAAVGVVVTAFFIGRRLLKKGAGG